MTWQNEIESLEKKLAANVVTRTPVELEDADGETEICTPSHHEDEPADAICAILNPDPIGTGTLSTNRSAHQTGTPFAQLIQLPDTLRGVSASFKTNGHRTGAYGMRKSAAVTVGQNSDNCLGHTSNDGKVMPHSRFLA